MKKLGLALMLVVVNTGVLAKWEEKASSNDDGLTMYVDRASIRKSGATVKMWSLYDFKVIQQSGDFEPYRSLKNQSEYDCNAEKYRILYFSHHTEKMSKGNVNFNYDSASNWKPVPPESMIEVLWKFACDR